MITITHIITDELGIHARPAGRLVKKAAEFPCATQIGTSEKMVDAKRIMGVMGLALKHGDELTMTFSGEKEAKAAEAMRDFLIESL